MYKVTIAIPVYNAQDYIRESLLSALNQTFKNIEILVIDDNGSDKSMDIVYDIVNTHNRGKDIRVITHKSNQGPANARNTALKKAMGEYLYFLDIDDTITENCIEILYNKIAEFDVDFVSAAYQKVYKDGQKIVPVNNQEIIIKGNHKIANFFFKESKHTTIESTVWNKLYRLSFLRNNNITFIPDKLYEDMIFTFCMILKAESCILLSDILYNYKIRQNSIMQYNPRNIIPIKEIEDSLFFNTYKKNESIKHKNSSFFESMITQIMMNCFNDISVIIDKKKIISEKISPNKIKEALAYPISFSEVCKFKRHKVLNLSLIIFSKLPYWIEILFLKIYLKLQRIYRKIR